MSFDDFSDLIIIKKLDVRQTEFVKKLVVKGGEFDNKDLAKFWGAKAFPSSFKKLLIQNPPILILIQARPQKYKLNTLKPTTKVIKPTKDTQKATQELKTLREEFNVFKAETEQGFQTIFQELDNLKNSITYRQKLVLDEDYILEISDLETEILLVYNRLKVRLRQPIKIGTIWEEIIKNHPRYKWEIFSQQILKINTKNFHLEEGIAGRYIYDPNSNKKYGYVIGN